jgi:hypothetical protein
VTGITQQRCFSVPYATALAVSAAAPLTRKPRVQHAAQASEPCRPSLWRSRGSLAMFAAIRRASSRVNLQSGPAWGRPANQSRCRRAGQQNRTYGLGHDGARGAVQGTKITAGRGLAEREQKASTNWRGHDDVMQIRSFRGLGEPARGHRIIECARWIGTRSAQSIRASGHPRRINRPDPPHPTNAAETSENSSRGAVHT